MKRNLSTASVLALLTIIDRGIEDMTMIARRSFHANPDQSTAAYKMRDELQCWLVDAVTEVTGTSAPPHSFSLSLEPLASPDTIPEPSPSSSS